MVLQPKEMVGFLVLLNQLMCKFNSSLRDIMEEVYPVVASRIFNLIPRDGFPSRAGAVTEVYLENKSLFRFMISWLPCYCNFGNLFDIVVSVISSHI